MNIQGCSQVAKLMIKSDLFTESQVLNLRLKLGNQYQNLIRLEGK